MESPRAGTPHPTGKRPDKEQTDMGIISLLIIGLVVGLLARAILPGRQAIPIWLTVLIGVGGLLLGALFFNSNRHLLPSIIVGTIISIILLAIVDRMGAGRRSRV